MNGVAEPCNEFRDTPASPSCWTFPWLLMADTSERGVKMDLAIDKVYD